MVKQHPPSLDYVVVASYTRPGRGARQTRQQWDHEKLGGYCTKALAGCPAGSYRMLVNRWGSCISERNKLNPQTVRYLDKPGDGVAYVSSQLEVNENAAIIFPCPLNAIQQLADVTLGKEQR